MFVSAYTATIPERIRTLEKAVASVLRQVDKMQVVLNNFKTVPKFLINKKITIVRHDNSLEDGSRFFNIDKANDYTLVFDDDILYPPNYVSVMKYRCDTLTALHKCPVIVAPMGKVLKPRPIKSYYQDIANNYKTFQDIDYHYIVDVPGACGILWNTEHVKITEDIITKQIHHSDICVAKFARENGILCICVAHKANWLKNLLPEVPKSPTIFGKYRRNDSELTEFVNKWI